MVTTALDGDGTLWDCRREWYDRSTEAWLAIEGTEFPMSYERFNDYVWSVVRPEHIMQNAKLASLNIELPKNIKDLERLRSRFDVFSHVNAFYNFRQKALKDKENWLKKHELYDGVIEMLNSLESLGTNNVMVTSKDRQSTIELLKHFKVDGFIDKLYPKELGSRSKQFSRLSEDYKGEFIIVYDDMPQNLEVARSFGFLPIAAPQGYSRPLDIAEYKSAWPKEFVGIVEGVINEKL